MGPTWPMAFEEEILFPPFCTARPLQISESDREMRQNRSSLAHQVTPGKYFLASRMSRSTCCTCFSASPSKSG